MGFRGKIRIVFILVFVLSVFSVSSPGIGLSAPQLPDVQQLTGITMGKEVLWSPGRLAVAGDGTLYVVDSYKNRIVKFDGAGNYTGDIAFPRVSAVAVAPNGTLYIGSHQDYSVSIFSNGKVVGQLGDGKNEFRSINDIAYDASTGIVYVADNVGNAVRIFDAGGRDLGSIGGVNLPVSVEVTGDAIYVIDAPVVKDNTFATTASRISIFDKQYNLTDTIDEPAGQHLMYRPADLKVADGIIYVADVALRSVLMFDTAGVFQGEIKSADNGIYTAVSLDLSPNGILYVSSSETHSIYLFELTANPGAGAGSNGSGF